LPKRMLMGILSSGVSPAAKAPPETTLQATSLKSYCFSAIVSCVI
jgi:hypothetical protein